MHAMNSTSRALCASAALALLLAACGDDPSAGSPEDECNNSCIPELGEVCNPVTRRCEIPTPDGGTDADAGDQDQDVPDTADEPDLVIECESDNACDDDEYCDDDGQCVRGCRDNPNNCTNCGVFPTTCTDGLACSPVDRECVSSCFRDADCLGPQFCQIATGLCQRGCRDNPDTCFDITGRPEFTCNLATRQCIGGTCGNDDACIDGAYCNSGRCFWGCRVNASDCGTGQVCDGQSRTCVFRDCNCEAGDSNEECDAFCNEGGLISSLYCDRDSDTCAFGCRIFDDGSDNCRPGRLCDETSRVCIDGCTEDGTCPFFTWCDEGMCETGCKTGECLPTGTCDLDTHTCISLPCTDDTDCPAQAYCGPGGCTDGCRLDDPATTEVDEDSCLDPQICSSSTHACIVGVCGGHGDCPLGNVCVGTVCVSGCAGLDERCPAGQPCSSQTLQCGCLRESDCPGNTHCSAPVCEVDCIPDNPDTTSVDEDNCPDPTNCDPSNGLCRSGCIDTAEANPGERNDFPGDAHCAFFSTADTSDPNQTRLCNGFEPEPPETYCAGEEDTWCQAGVACTGQDEDWYTFYLYPGDEISASVVYPSPASRHVVLVLTFEDNPIQVVRGATATADGLAFSSPVRITNAGQYFLRLFQTDAQPLPYELRVEVDRVFFCREDIYDPASDNPTTGAPTLIAANDTVSLDGLAICGGDRDFYAVELFAGNVFDAALDASEDDALLNLALGLANGPRDDLVSPPTASGALDTGTEDPNDVLLTLASVPSTNAYYVRVTPSNLVDETLYSLDLERGQGTATCPGDTFEPNDTTAEALSHSGSRFRIADTTGAMTFNNARLCPAPEAGVTDIDLYRVEVTREDVSGGFLTASLTGVGAPLLELEILTAALAPVATTTSASGEVTTNSGLAGPATYFVRVMRDVEDAEIPWLGAAYSLRLEYAPSLCTNDAFEDNDAPERATPLHSSLLLGTGDECGIRGFSAGTCLDDEIGVPPLCLCDTTPSLRLCGLDDDWYRFAMLVGDTFTVKVTPTNPADLPRMSALLYPPNCTPGDATCEAAVFLGSSPDPNSLQTPAVAVNPLAGSASVVLQNYLVVEHRSGGPIDYQVTVEVQAEASRTCPADSWDEENLALYPGPNDTDTPPTPGCGESSCTLVLDGVNNSRHGQLCYWDQQDWFRFAVPPNADELVLLQFTEDEGRMQGELYQVLGGGLVLVNPLQERPNENGEPAGWDRVYYGLSAGFYQVKVHMPPAIGGLVGSTTPNDFTITVRPGFCGDGVWSNDEECDTFAPVSDSVMCGPGGVCNGCTCD